MASKPNRLRRSGRRPHAGLMYSGRPRYPRSRRLDFVQLQPTRSRADGKPPRDETPAERAVRIETRMLEQRLRQLETSQRAAREAIEEELRREHWGHMPEGWHERPER